MIIEAVKPKPLNWIPSFSASHKIPFGSYILFETLDNLFPKEGISITGQPVYNTLPDSIDISIGNYLFISNEFEPDQLDTEILLSFAEEGGNVFIATESIGQDFCDSLGFSTNAVFEKDSLIVTLKEINDGVDSFAIKQAGLSWYIDKYDSLKTNVLGYDKNNRTNFIKMDFGEGQLFIHTVPLAFANYNFLKTGNADYVAGLLSYLPNEAIIWDEYYKPMRSLKSSSPIKFILQTRALRWAYFLALAGLVLFIFVEGKRKQRIVPIIKPLSNDTLNYVDVIGRLYYGYANHTDVAIKMRTYLLEFIRHDYNLDTSILDEKFVRKLASKTAIEQSELQVLFNTINKINPETKMLSGELVGLNKELEIFYKNCQ